MLSLRKSWRGVKVSDKTLYDMEKLFAQFTMIANKRKIKLDYVFQVWDVTSTKVTLQGPEIICY